jgi:hypothetical protein
VISTSQLALPDLTGELVALDSCCCVTVTQNPPAGTLLNPGSTMVTFTATDPGGLSSVCHAVVSVIVEPTVIGATYTGGRFSGSFQSFVGFDYSVQYKDDLNDPEWTTLSVGGFSVIPGDGTVKTFSDFGPLPIMRFYRVIVMP